MATWNSPAVARRWLAHELRTRREALGLSQSAVGRACGWSGVKVSYIENAQQKSITDEDLDKLLPTLKVLEAEHAAFYEAATATRERGWWERYDEDVVPDFMAEFIGLEQGASSIRTLEPTIVPGLLQTSGYMTAVIEGDMKRRTSRTVREIVAVRTRRQKVLVRTPDPVDLVAIVDESVLRRVVGGSQVMAEQLWYMAEVCERPNVALHVYPFERGVSPGLMMSSHRILHFPGRVPPIVYMEARDSAQWIDDPSMVDFHDLAVEEVIRASLSTDDSQAMVIEAAEGYASST